MTVYSLENGMLGVRNERPSINDPTIPRHGSQPPTYICIDTLDVFQDTGSAWLFLGQIGGSASIAGLAGDGSNGILVTGEVTAPNASLSGPGGTTPTLAVTKLAGQTGLFLACTDENNAPKVSIAVDGEIVTADDVLAPNGVIKAATLALYTSGTGAPTSGAHTKGEFHGDAAGALFYCTADGTPGTWIQAGTLAGLTSDGANGVVVADALTAGDSAAAVTPDFHSFSGVFQVVDTPANASDGDTTAFVIQSHDLVQNQIWETFGVYRRGDANGHTVSTPILKVESSMTGDTGPLQRWVATGGNVAEIGNTAGLGLFGHAAPAAPRTLAQSVITAIADANAKTAIQALADTLADMGALTLT